MICRICNKDFKNTKSLRIHLNSHNIKGYFNWYQYLHKYENIPIPKCPYCGNNCTLQSIRGYQKTCGNKECKSKYNSQCQKEKYILHPELREKCRERRINFLSKQANRDKTAWINKAKGKYSYLEKYFIDNYLIPNNLQNKFNIINEYSEYPYFLDFAFIDIKVDIEIDGRCHFNNGIDRINHDIIRDKELTQKGWKVYRISFNEIEKEDTKYKFIEFINNYNNYNYNCNRQIIKYNIYKEQKKKKEIKEKINIKNAQTEKIISILDKVANNNDLTKFGYGKIIQTELANNDIYIKGNIKQYIRLHYPDFFLKYNIYKSK